ncbi:MAG: hypothetical protein ACE5IB_04960, partial [Candidatus Geothermarchaeales archaeon]
MGGEEMLVEAVLEALDHLAESKRIEVGDECVVGSVLLPEERFEEAVAVLTFKIRDSLPRGEVILCRIREGRVVDMGAESLKVLDGFYAEGYDYDNLSAVFLRAYLLTDGRRRWTAVYMDENSRTPWWP